MSKPTKDDLLEFMKKHGPENVDSITDQDSAIRHFRTSSKVYKQQRDEYKNERDTLIDDIAVLRANNKRLELENNGLKLELDSLDVLISEISLNTTRYDVLTEHIRQKAEANPSVSRYIDLVNYIDRLEQK